MKNIKKKRYLFILILLLIAILIVCLRSCEYDSENINNLLPIDDIAENWIGKQNLPNEKDNNAKIEIPGFGSLNFFANEKNQKVNFYNPESNDCLFQMTLYVEEVELWRSGYVLPGKGYYNIELSDALKSGTYNAYLLINCFREDGTALNGARVEFKLNVI